LVLEIFYVDGMSSLLHVMSDDKMLQLCLITDYFLAREAMEYGLVDGFLEEIDLADFLSKFKNISSSGVTAGFKAARELPSLAVENRYHFLLESLHALKSSEDVKNRIFKKD